MGFATADLNGDGSLDLAVANNTGNSITVLLGNGDGTLNTTTTATYAAGNGPTSIAVADYNGDGILDLAVTDQTDNAVSLLIGLPGGTFSSNFELPVGTTPLSITTADFNNNGLPDVAVANNGSNTVSVILNDATSSTTTSSNGATSTAFPNGLNTSFT